MSPSRVFLAFLLVFGLTAPGLGQDTVNLQWKFEKGKTFYQEMTTVTKQSMKVMGMDITQNQNQTFIFSWAPKDQDKDKNWLVQQKIEGVKMEIEIGGNKIIYDSTKDAQAGNPLGDFFKALVGSEFTLTLSPEMKVLKIEGKDEFIKKLIQANQQMEPLLKQILSDEALKQMAEPSFAAVSGKAVKKGETWSKNSMLNMGPIGTYKTTYNYTYEGPEKSGDKTLQKIKVDTVLEYSPPPEGTSSGLPFRIKSAKLESKKATGTILFDNDKGRLDSSDMSLELVGKLGIEISGMMTDVELTQSQTTKIKTSDTNPVSTPPPKK